MKVTINEPPRTFKVGPAGRIQLKDCAHINLEADEQITLKTEDGGEYDLVRKEWGFYATPSLNGRLPRFGLRAVLVRSPGNLYYVMLVEAGKESLFHEYLALENHQIISWLDSQQALDHLAKVLDENDKP
mgnify:CR=1 FL=1